MFGNNIYKVTRIPSKTPIAPGFLPLTVGAAREGVDRGVLVEVALLIAAVMGHPDAALGAHRPGGDSIGEF